MAAFRAELQKAHRRHDLALCLLIPGIVVLWVGGLAPADPEELANGYSALLYSLPVIEAILMPVMMAVLASRLWDMEIKGNTTKLLYTLLLDRATLSQKNNWIDAQGRIYVLYPLSSLAKDLGCSISSITRSFTELENAQLVERIRSGFSKPSRILLKVPHTTQNCTVIVSKNAEHDCAEMSNMIAQKCTPNQRNKNDLKDNHLIKTTDAHLTFGEYRNVFLTEKEYKRLKSDFSGLDDLIEQLSAYIQSTGRKYADHAATLRIWTKRQKTEQKSTPGIPDYTFKEGESL